MTTQPMELLSAFIDGEEVEPRELAEALGAPGAREMLRDFALLRAEVREDDLRPSAAFYAAMEEALGGESGIDRRPWWVRAIPVPAPALAAMVLIAVLVGGWTVMGLRPATIETTEELPPEPDRVVRFEPGVDWQQQE